MKITAILILAVAILAIIYQGVFSPFARLQRAFNKFQLRGFIYLDSNDDIWEYDLTPLDVGGRRILLPKHQCKKIYIRYIGTESKKEAMRGFAQYLLIID